MDATTIVYVLLGMIGGAIGVALVMGPRLRLAALAGEGQRRELDQARLTLAGLQSTSGVEQQRLSEAIALCERTARERDGVRSELLDKAERAAALAAQVESLTRSTAEKLDLQRDTREQTATRRGDHHAAEPVTPD